MVHGDKKLLTDTVPVNKELLTGTVPVNNLFQIIIEIVPNMPLPVVCLRATECNATACAKNWFFTVKLKLSSLLFII